MLGVFAVVEFCLKMIIKEAVGKSGEGVEKSENESE